MTHTFAPQLSFYAATGGAPVLDQAGNIYGTMTYGLGNGNVYKLTPGKHGKFKPETLHRFKNYIASYPGIVFDAAGNLYGTTEGRSHLNKHNPGAVYELVPSGGAGSYEEETL